MSNYTPERLISNIVNNFNYVKSDFLDITVFNSDILTFFLSLSFVVFLFIILYSLGDKFRLIIFKKIELENAEFFVNIAFGYILVGTGIEVLGILSLFYWWSLYLFFAAAILLSLYPLSSLKNRIKKIGYIFEEYKQIFKKYPLINTAILGFVIIGFLRLIPPETGVDAIWYHTDYPKLYLEKYSMMNVDPKGNFYPIVTPTLGDMYYVITQSIGLKDASRVIHYAFYMIVVLFYIVGLDKNKSRIYLYAGLLLVTSPVIIRHTSTAYNEFQWILCWLAAVIIIVRKYSISNKEIMLSAILFGGALATKLWMLPFYVAIVAYLFLVRRKSGLWKILKTISIFVLFSLSVPFLWYVRAYIVTGNPFFPAFWTFPSGEFNLPLVSADSFTLEGLKNRALGFLSLSPFAIAGLFFLFMSPFKQIAKNKRLVIFSIMLLTIQILVSYSWHRFLIPFYSVFVIVLGIGISAIIVRYKIFRTIFFTCIFIMFSYYFLNATMSLPYGLGWADKNKYLTRILSRDNSSYYDYEQKFSKFITKNDIVATYGLWGFYYGNFNYIYSEDIFRKEGRSLDLLAKNSATKLLIKGGDIEWLCEVENINDCNKKKFVFLTNHVFGNLPASQYLYGLVK